MYVTYVSWGCRKDMSEPELESPLDRLYRVEKSLRALQTQSLLVNSFTKTVVEALETLEGRIIDLERRLTSYEDYRTEPGEGI